jgi:catalase
MPKPTPSSFAAERYFGVTALRFVNAAGVARYGRYRITPEAGMDHLDPAAAAARDSNFLHNELSARIRQGPTAFQIAVQLAEDGDVVNDATIHWPETRQTVPLGRLELSALVQNNDREQMHTIFDPIPRVDGIEPSDDPLLELRAAVYLISGRRRRQAEKPQSATASAPAERGSV